MEFIIQKYLDQKSLEEDKISRKMQVKALQNLKKAVFIKSTTLFIRLTTLADGTADVSDYLKYELSLVLCLLLKIFS